MEVFKKLILALVDVGQLTTKLDQTGMSLLHSYSLLHHIKLKVTQNAAMILKRALHRNNTHRLRCAAFDILLIVLAEVSSICQPNEPINSTKSVVFGDTPNWSKAPILKRYLFLLLICFPLSLFNFNVFYFIFRSTLGTAGRAEFSLLTTFSTAIDLRGFNPSSILTWKKELDGMLDCNHF